MMTTTSPLLTERSTPFSTCVAPKCLCTPRASTTTCDSGGIGRHRDVGDQADRPRGIGLEPALDKAPYRRQEQIIESGDDEDLEHLELHLYQELRTPQQFLHRDHRGER